MTKFYATLTGVVACVLGAASAAQADGEYYQFDLSPSSSTMVASAVRGNWGAAAALSVFEGGGSVSANTTYGFDVPALGENASVRVGPTVQIDDDNNFDAGAKVVFERFSATDWGGLFVLADYNTIQNAYLFLAEVSETQYGFSAAFSVQGDDGDFRENSLIFGYQIAGSDLRLRAGYKFEAQEAVLGFSVNTF